MTDGELAYPAASRSGSSRRRRREIVEDLEAALAEFSAVAESLGVKP